MLILMKPSPLINYIKAHRKQWKMCQKELGFLLGYDSNVSISNIELGEKSPSATDLMTLELLFDKAANKLFPDVYHDAAHTLLRRLKLFEEQLTEATLSQDSRETLDHVKRVREQLTSSVKCYG